MRLKILPPILALLALAACGTTEERTVVVTAPPASSQAFNPKTCQFSSTTDVNFAALGNPSTGKFAGVSGRGAVQFDESGYVPRYTSGKKKGQCNTSPNAPELTKGAVASFTLDAVLTKP